jgi:1-acyl-sn-glycerol-3-phosphate acyltransferase
MMAQVIELHGPRAERGRCQALTAAGRRCRNRAVGESGFCRVHRPSKAPERIGPFPADEVQEALAFLSRRLTGDYEVDEFGFDRELTERVFLPLVRPLMRQWFRIEWRGLERVPDRGAALLVANHAGTIPMDAVMMKFGVLDEHPAHRHVRLLAADLAFRMPFIGALARKSGNTLAGPEDAERLLRAGELLGVFPEGYKGVGKPFRERYRLQRFGRGGFIELALKTRSPMVPVSIVGSEEIYPKIGDLRPLARLLGLPYFPITPTFPWLGPLGAIPLPSRWIVEFGEPIPTDGYEDDAWQDGMLVFELTDQVRDSIQQTLYRNLMTRRSTFL